MSTAELTLNPIGITIGCVFAVSIASLMWWMLHPPAPVQAAVAKALRGLSAVHRILVPGDENPVSFDCQKPTIQNCRMTFFLDKKELKYLSPGGPTPTIVVFYQ